MDSLADIGLIDASYDGGNSWIPVRDTFLNNSGAFFMWYQDYHAIDGNSTNHLVIISGRSDGWINSKFCWQWYLAVRADTIITNPDSLLIRFTFISDSISDNREGWMIDHIVTSSGEPESCSSTKESYADEDITVYPNPFSAQTLLQTQKVFKNATLTVWNSLGHQVKQIKNISGESVIFKRDDLQSGFYFLHLTQDNMILKTCKIFILDY